MGPRGLREAEGLELPDLLQQLMAAVCRQVGLEEEQQLVAVVTAETGLLNGPIRGH